MFNVYLICLFFALPSFTFAALNSSIHGESLITGKTVNLLLKNKDKKANVLIFMSAKCPCSDSHVPLVKKMANQYKDFTFTVIHSNSDESKSDSQKYFKKIGFNFEVIQDEKNQIADQLQAYKTPHAFVIGPNGEILYQGGITNSSHAPNADQFFLSNALNEISQGKPVSTPEGRTLGCVILRESEIK